MLDLAKKLACKNDTSSMSHFIKAVFLLCSILKNYKKALKGSQIRQKGFKIKLAHQICTTKPSKPLGIYVHAVFRGWTEPEGPNTIKKTFTFAFQGTGHLKPTTT